MLTKKKRDSKPKTKLVAKSVPALRMLYATQFDHTIHTLMRVLSPRSRSMMCRRFGLFGLEPHTLDAIGQQEGLTRIRVLMVWSNWVAKSIRNAGTGFATSLLLGLLSLFCFVNMVETPFPNLCN